MSNNYTILHLHSEDSNPYSSLEVDSITPFQDYINKAVELGMKAIAFTEHGCVLHNVAKKQMCDKVGIKYIHAEEFYVTEEINPEKLVRDNYHCLLFARNAQGIGELNKLSSKSFNRHDGHYYYNPRITLDELENTSDNILILTGCVAGMLCSGTNAVKERFLKFVIAHKDRCWLEIQPHNFDKQFLYNQYLYKISQEYGLRLIATNDIHAINADHLEGRKIMQKAKKVDFHNEDECDLSFKDYDQMIEAFRMQSALSSDIIKDALEETNRFADLIESYELDYSNKYPRLYKNAEGEFKKRIGKGIKERGIDKLPNYESEYVPRIKEELETYKHNDAIDFMLLDDDYKLWMKENGMEYGPSRGSVSGSVIAYLIHNTDVDSVKYNLNFSRFMNPERASLADVDTDIYAEDRYKVREYFFNKPGLYCCNIVTFNTIQMKTAIKDVGRALGMTPAETQALSDEVYQGEDKKDHVPDGLREKYKELFKYVDIVIGTVTSLGRHAAGVVCSPSDIDKDFGTLSIASDPRPVSQIDMHEIDSLNYVKMDLLGLDAVGLIYKACQLAGIDYCTPDNVDFTDEKVIKSIAKDTTLIFQFESGFASEALKKTLSEETIANIKKQNPNVSYLDIMAMVNGAIRPAGESYRDSLFRGIYRDNGNKALNDFLRPTLGYLVYQCQIIDFLHDFCGFTMGQADIVRRHFAKKTGTENDIPIIKDGGYMVDIKGNKDTRYIKGFITTAQEKYGMTKDEAEDCIGYFLRVIEDASSYLFSKNHSIPYSMIGFFIGYLRYYYPLELLTAALNVYQDNSKKMASITTYAKSLGIQIRSIKFRKSKAEYFMDKEENAIYQGIAAIKGCNGQIADELFDLGKNEYKSFIDLLADIKEKTSVKSNQLDSLIRLGFFDEFGNPACLLKYTEIFNTYYDMKQIKKDKAFENKIDFDLIRKCCEKETPKVFAGIDGRKLANELVKRIPEYNTTLQQRVAWQMDILGFPTIVDKKYVGQCVVTDVNVKYTPVVSLYALANGNTIKVKIPKKIFAASPLNRKEIVKIEEYHREFKRTMIDGQWQNTKEKEWWVYRYKIL